MDNKSKQDFSYYSVAVAQRAVLEHDGVYVRGADIVSPQDIGRALGDMYHDAKIGRAVKAWVENGAFESSVGNTHHATFDLDDLMEWYEEEGQ